MKKNVKDNWIKAGSSVRYMTRGGEGSNFVNSVLSYLNSGWPMVFRHAKNHADH